MQTWAEIDLDAIRNNVRRMQTRTTTPVMAVVKANAYGHGMVEVARAALEGGAEWLGVARAEEGLELRARGITAPTLVMGYTPTDSARAAIGGGLSLTVFDFHTACTYARIGLSLNKRVPVHIKIDTGMGRLGVLPDEAPDFIQAVRELSSIYLEGVFTHLANADIPQPDDDAPMLASDADPRLPQAWRKADDATSVSAQLFAFRSILQSLTFRPPFIHAANSAGALAHPESRFDIVRMGIALYGLNPSLDVLCPSDFRPALTWKAKVTQVKTLPPGHGISYGSEYITKQTEKLATVSVGYADGFRRVLNNEVLIHGKRAPVRGKVCMDQIVVSVDNIRDVAVDDEVVLLGEQGREAITADDLAEKWGTINYEVTCGLGSRVERVYHNLSTDEHR